MDVLGRLHNCLGERGMGVDHAAQLRRGEPHLYRQRPLVDEVRGVRAADMDAEHPVRGSSETILTMPAISPMAWAFPKPRNWNRPTRNRMPRSRACCSRRPTLPTSGIVNMPDGTADSP